jgi:integrase
MAGRKVGEKVGRYGAGSLKETAPGSGQWDYGVRINGRQVWRRSPRSIQLTPKQAERWKNEMYAQLVAEPPAAAMSVPARTVSDLLNEWCDRGRSARGVEWSRRQKNDARSRLDHRIIPALGEIRLADLTSVDIENAFDSWSLDGLSDSSVHRHAADIRSALSFAGRRGYEIGPTATKAMAPPQPKSKAKPIAPDQLPKLLNAAEDYGHDMLQAICLAATTGARRGEISGLRWADVDLRAGTIRIERQVVVVRGELFVEDTKNDTQYTARLSARDVAVLNAVLDPGKPDHYVLGNGAEPINPNHITDGFTSVRGAAHVRGVTFKSLRHYWTTSMADAGVPTKDIASGRWKTDRMVREVYGRHATLAGSDKMAEVDMLPS